MSRIAKKGSAGGLCKVLVSYARWTMMVKRAPRLPSSDALSAYLTLMITAPSDVVLKRRSEKIWRHDHR